MPILGDTDLSFTVDGHEFTANVSVSSAIDDFLLGSDWLIRKEAKWDFAAGTISFGNRTIHAYRCTLDRMCKRVIVSEDCVIPARHEANVPVKVLNVDIPHRSDNWAIETCQLKSRVMLARHWLMVTIMC